MYQLNPLMESNFKSFSKFVKKVGRSPKAEENLSNLALAVGKKLPKQRSLPGFETRGEKKLLKIGDELLRLDIGNRNRKNAARVAYRFVEVR